MLSLLGTTPLVIAVFFGSAQNCLSKAAKYSVFDATKEMAFIPLPHEIKLKGKAAIDGIGSRLGKSGGSLIHGGLLMIFHTLSSSSPYVAGILMLVIFFWIGATKSLGKQFAEEVGDHEAQDNARPSVLSREPQPQHQPVKAEA
jgi:ATP:ADP antiporter, AAA family